MTFKQQFWNKKILSWERDKYDRRGIFNFNSSVQHRLRLAESLLRQSAKGQILLELGCAGGRLWEKIQFLNFARYTGVDFSQTAISAFKEKAKGAKNQPSLFCEDCANNAHPADIVCSLGLLDWLSMEKIKQIAKNYKNLWHLHSFSEKSFRPAQAIHALYVFALYGRKNRAYTPHYRKADDLLSVFGEGFKIFRSPRLSFGAFIYRLPDYVKI